MSDELAAYLWGFCCGALSCRMVLARILIAESKHGDLSNPLMLEANALLTDADIDEARKEGK